MKKDETESKSKMKLITTKEILWYFVAFQGALVWDARDSHTLYLQHILYVRCAHYSIILSPIFVSIFLRRLSVC